MANVASPLSCLIINEVIALEWRLFSGRLQITEASKGKDSMKYEFEEGKLLNRFY